VRKIFILIIFTLVSVTSSYGQGMSTTNTRAKFKSLFIYNFTKYTEWPENYKKGDFVIGVVSDSDLADALEQAAATKKINSQNVVVKRINSTDDISQCHVLYVNGKTSAEVSPFIEKAKGFSCLIITEGTGMIESVAAINFVIVGSAIKFEMNKSRFENRDLIVSNSLDKLATKVIN
jgi:hypothetical protein